MKPIIPLRLNLPNVKPMMPQPMGILYYMDFTYEDLKLKERRLKLDKIYEQIKSKQNGNIK